jgi:outer membrane protein TolC
MLPQITLSGSLGSVATTTGKIFAGQSEFWSAGASLSQTLFAGGTLLHRERAARAALDQAGDEYREAVLTAFQNVADALRALAADADAVQAADRAAALSQASLDIARRQYQIGAVNSLSLLIAQQTYQQALVNRAQARTSRYVDTAALFQALGGHAGQPSTGN